MIDDLNNIVNRYARQRRVCFQSAAASKTKTSSEMAIQRKSLNTAIAICNQKGGCAKTTTAVNLSASLAQRGYKTLLVDLDPQAHASLGLGIDIDTLENTIYDVIIHNVNIDSIIHRTSAENLDIAPANSMLAGAQLELADILGRELVLRTAIRKMKLTREYDFILFDCSPSLNLVTINALVAAEFVIIPIQTHYYSLEGMRELFSTLDIIKERLNAEIGILGILPTLFDARTKVSHQILQQIRSYFKDMVFQTVIHNNVKLCEAPMHKKPIQAYAPTSRGAQDYQSLCDELVVLLAQQGCGHIENHIENNLPEVGHVAGELTG